MANNSLKSILFGERVNSVFHRTILGHLFAIIPLLVANLLMRLFEELLGHRSLLSIIVDQSFLLAGMLQWPDIFVVDSFRALFGSCRLFEDVLMPNTHA